MDGMVFCSPSLFPHLACYVKNDIIFDLYLTQSFFIDSKLNHKWNILLIVPLTVGKEAKSSCFHYKRHLQQTNLYKISRIRLGKIGNRAKAGRGPLCIISDQCSLLHASFMNYFIELLYLTNLRRFSDSLTFING